MKNIDGFREYLLKAYVSGRTGKPLKPAVAHDVISRCRRVERVLGIDLDAVFRQKGAPMEMLAEGIKLNCNEFGYDGSKRYFYVYLITAVRHYYKFCRSGRERLAIRERTK